MKDIGLGIAWAGFWIMIGLCNFGEHRTIQTTETVCVQQEDNIKEGEVL